MIRHAGCVRRLGVWPVRAAPHGGRAHRFGINQPSVNPNKGALASLFLQRSETSYGSGRGYGDAHGYGGPGPLRYASPGNSCPVNWRPLSRYPFALSIQPVRLSSTYIVRAVGLSVFGPGRGSKRTRMAMGTRMTSARSGSACSAVVLAAVLVLIVTTGTAASHTMTNCSVSAIEGAPARLEVAGQWSALEPGPLPDGAETIATGPGARAEITCDAGLVVTIGAGTEVSLDALTQESDPGILRLLRGILGIDAPKAAFRGFEVQTPLAIASVRSTSWITEYGEVTGTAVFVRSGSVEVMSAERQPLARLDKGEGVTIVPGPDRSLPDPDTINVLEWGSARIDGAVASLGLGWR